MRALGLWQRDEPHPRSLVAQLILPFWERYFLLFPFPIFLFFCVDVYLTCAKHGRGFGMMYDNREGRAPQRELVLLARCAFAISPFSLES